MLLSAVMIKDCPEQRIHFSLQVAAHHRGGKPEQKEGTWSLELWAMEEQWLLIYGSFTSFLNSLGPPA